MWRTVGELAAGITTAVHQGLEGVGLLDRLEVVADAVLDELVLQDLVGGQRALGLDAGERRQAGDRRRPATAARPRRSPTAPALVPPDPDRLELAPGLERLGEPVEGLGVELLAGLVGVGASRSTGIVRASLGRVHAVVPARDAVAGRGRGPPARGRPAAPIDSWMFAPRRP